jgi:hypothetical protein
MDFFAIFFTERPKVARIAEARSRRRFHLDGNELSLTLDNKVHLVI